jgi:atypical dual specificity phosphatase
MLNFSYIIPGVLAGSSFPRGREDLEHLVKEGIQVLVTAMEHNLDEQLVKVFGLEYHYYAVLPYGTPSLTDINRFVDLVNENRAKKRPVAVHCWMGWGRTGTFLAAYLISEGMSADEAIYRVREKRPNSIETFGQEQFLHIYEQSLELRK